MKRLVDLIPGTAPSAHQHRTDGMVLISGNDKSAHGATPASFGELLEHADYLVIQAPLTKETHHLLISPPAGRWLLRSRG